MNLTKTGIPKKLRNYILKNYTVSNDDIDLMVECSFPSARDIRYAYKLHIFVSEEKTFFLRKNYNYQITYIENDKVVSKSFRSLSDATKGFNRRKGKIYKSHHFVNERTSYQSKIILDKPYFTEQIIQTYNDKYHNELNNMISYIYNVLPELDWSVSAYYQKCQQEKALQIAHQLLNLKQYKIVCTINHELFIRQYAENAGRATLMDCMKCVPNPTARYALVAFKHIRKLFNEVKEMEYANMMKKLTK